MSDQHPIDRFGEAKAAHDRAIAGLIELGGRLERIARVLKSPPHRIVFPGRKLPMDTHASAPSFAPEEFPTLEQVWRVQEQMIAADHDLQRARHELTTEQRRTLGI